jgi:hypothetical protein
MPGNHSLVGRPIDGLTLPEQLTHTGRWVALEIYTPQKLPLRTIQAEGANVAECIAQLIGRGLEPGQFEFQLLQPPY